MKAKLSAPWAQGAASSRREPTVSEIASGFPCGQADQFLFNELIYRLTMQEAELANVVTGAGGTASESDLQQVLKALRSQRANYTTASGGSANAITLTYNPAFAALADLTRVPLRFSVAATNTGPATLSVDGLAVKALTHHDGSAFVGGEIVPGAIIEAMYDGSAFRLRSVGGGYGYREHDVTTGGYALPSLAPTPPGYEMTLRLTGTPTALPMPAITVTGGGSIIWRGQAVASLPTFGRGEVLHFRRVSDGWLMSVLAQAQRAALLATDGATVWQAGPYAYAQIPYLTTVGGEAENLFGFDGKKFTTPVAGEYFMQVRGQFNADAETGGAGVAITAGAFTTIGNAMNYSYADIAAGFSVNVATNVTHWLPAGQRVDFNFALTNGASRIRAQDFGVNVVYLGR